MEEILVSLCHPETAGLRVSAAVKTHLNKHREKANTSSKTGAKCLTEEKQQACPLWGCKLSALPVRATLAFFKSTNSLTRGIFSSSSKICLKRNGFREGSVYMKVVSLLIPVLLHKLITLPSSRSFHRVSLSFSLSLVNSIQRGEDRGPLLAMQQNQLKLASLHGTSGKVAEITCGKEGQRY